ncbi:MAG: adenosylcobinamide-GDP ribazoletransferase [Lachnospiraceae bacterium]
MSVLRSLVIAFSMYSAIPVPQFEWKEKDMRYVIAFFPLVGVVIGAATVFWWWICQKFGLSALTRAGIGLALPLLLSGGIHMDGYMDTMDALHSYQGKERKLEILKDSHIGAFSVIGVLVWALLALASYAQITGKNAVCLLAGSFWLSRIFSGIAVVSFPNAKSDGLLYLFSSKAEERIVKGALYIQLFLWSAVFFWLTGWNAVVVFLTALGIFAYYYWRTKKEFGGITGDTAGWFVQICELGIAFCAMCISVVAGR